MRNFFNLLMLGVLVVTAGFLPASALGRQQGQLTTHEEPTYFHLGLVAYQAGNDYSAIAAHFPYVYVYGADSSNDNRLLVLDVSEPSQPTMLSSLPEPDGVTDLAIFGDYVLSTNGGPDLQVIDATNPYSLTVVAHLDIPASAQSVLVKGTYAFVAGGAIGLQVVDLANPRAPTIIGTYVGKGAYDIALFGDTAYLLWGNGFTIVDITDPHHPTYIGEFVMTGLGGLDAIAADDKYVYVTYLSFPPTDGFIIVDVHVPSTPVEVKRIDSGNGRCMDIAVADHYVYYVCSDKYWNDQIRVYDVIDAQNPVYASGHVIYLPQRLVLDGSLVYVTASGRISGGGLHILTPLRDVYYLPVI
jgi:hypothetical protein